MAAGHQPDLLPPAADAGGDVQNAKGWTKGNDSFWMYCGSPIMTLPDGRQYTAMYAVLIVDLDGKVNVNALGNVQGINHAHRSPRVGARGK